MIYIPIETRLKWIQEDIEQIKSSIFVVKYDAGSSECPDCKFAKTFGKSSCEYHAPEYAMRIDFQL